MSLLAIDDHIAGADMVAEMFNILGFHLPNVSPHISDRHYYDPRLYCHQHSPEDVDKMTGFSNGLLTSTNILSSLSPADVRAIVRLEDAGYHLKRWSRLAPSADHRIFRLIPSPSYYDLLLHSWLLCPAADKVQHISQLCEDKLHLKIAESVVQMDRFPFIIPMFPNVPPFVNFIDLDQEYDPPLPDELRQMTWNAPGEAVPIIQDCVIKAGFTICQFQVRKKEDQVSGAIWDSLPITEKEKDEICFQNLTSEVKINQFPGLFSIGRKDSLWLGYKKMREKWGSELFNFHTKTYILGDDMEELREAMRLENQPFILKPPNWFCGIGIKMIHRLEEIENKDSKTIVQEYIDNPLLINGLKFDIRIYVLMTDVEPLKLYVYEDGLVRFATEKYTNNLADLGNNFIHLTNYTINKESPRFVQSEEPGEFSGHKWNLATLWRYFDEVLNIDWRPVWAETREVCVKTIMCGYDHIREEVDNKVRMTSCKLCSSLFCFRLDLTTTATNCLVLISCMMRI